MGDEAGLLRAVCAAPEDDAPRLIYADYLDETGQSDRATYIRVQCELVRRANSKERKLTYDCKCSEVRTCKGCKKYEELKRQWELEDSDLLTWQSKLQTQRNLNSWFPGFNLLATHKPHRDGRPIGHIARGFVHDVNFYLEALEDQMRVVFQLYPVQQAHILGICPVPKSVFGGVGWGFPPITNAPKWLETIPNLSFGSTEAAVRCMSSTLVLQGRRMVGLA